METDRRPLAQLEHDLLGSEQRARAQAVAAARKLRLRVGDLEASSQRQDEAMQAAKRYIAELREMMGEMVREHKKVASVAIKSSSPPAASPQPHSSSSSRRRHRRRRAPEARINRRAYPDDAQGGSSSRFVSLSTMRAE